MYEITFLTESGDRVTGGPFYPIPTYEEVMKLAHRDIPDDAVYIEELVATGAWSKKFWTVIALSTGRPTLRYESR